jgi:hypothetical protein
MDIKIITAIMAAALLVQVWALVAMFLVLRKTSKGLKNLAEKFRTQVLPTVEVWRLMSADLRPKLQTTVANVAHVKTGLRFRVRSLDASLRRSLDRTALQVFRLEELVIRTMDRLQDAIKTVHRTLILPILTGRKLLVLFRLLRMH